MFTLQTLRTFYNKINSLILILLFYPLACQGVSWLIRLGWTDFVLSLLAFQSRATENNGRTPAHVKFYKFEGQNFLLLFTREVSSVGILAQYRLTVTRRDATRDAEESTQTIHLWYCGSVDVMISYFSDLFVFNVLSP